MLAKQGGLKPVFDQPLARPGDRVDTGLQRRRDLAIAPARTTLRGVSFQQDAGLQQLLCRMFPAMDKGGELLSFLIAECHDVLLYRDLFSGHEPAPSLVTGASRQKIDVESMTDTTTSRSGGGFSIWWRSSTGPVGRYWRGDYQIRWTSRFVLRGWRTRWVLLASRGALRPTTG